MNKISSVVSLSFLIILLLVSPVIGSSDWVEYGRDIGGTVWSYNKVNIEKDGGMHIVQVWEKIVFSDKGRENIIQDRTKNGYSTEGWDKLSEGKGLFEIDCNKQRIRMLSVHQYDTDGNVLFSYSDDNPEWDYIPPNTLVDTSRKKVCE